ncbi:MAG: KR domain-containing protein, partial [Gammaproteobacteria bacterium]|nr:KR domain-containing protein [Gammaproteobacteria bacterium]
VTNTDAVDAMLARMDRDLPPLGGIIYSAGTLSDGALTNQSWERFETVLWPKILGAWHLHRATAHRDLDMFILFSSRVGIIGNAGQVNHASANAFLDQLAGHRRALGLPGQAIAWGSWSEIGEAAEQLQRIEQQRASLGGRAFSPQQGLKVFDQIVRHGNTNSVAMATDWSVFEQNVKDIPPLFENLISNATDAEPDSHEISGDLIPRLRTASPSERETLLVSFLQQELQAVLRLRTSPDLTIGFFDLGMDSLMAVELRNRLNRAFDSEMTVSNTAVFDYPNISELARHLLDQLPEVSDTPIEQKQPEPVQQPTVVPQRTDEEIAIVGMACRFPGAPDIDSYWSQLEAGYDAVTDGRRDPGPWEGVVGDTAAEDDIYRHGGFVEGIDLFDADFFGIRPIEARLMDPRQRLLLETSWHALEDAGIDPYTLKDTQSGVYVGLGSSEYRDLVRDSGQEDSYLGTAISAALGRIAFVLGLRGPAVPLDMTCASSLAAVHQAATALRQGEVNLSLVGGVHSVFSRSVTKFMSEYGMLSPSGRCRTFDASADGFVRGEGCGIVIMKRLSDAIADGDRIWGLVLGSSVNQNGMSAALTVPRGIAQEQLLEESLARAGISPSEVDYLETHATGSQLGDPIEVSVAASVYGKGRTQDQPLLLGTVKTNIGHLEAAAGIAGLIKVMLSMRRGKIPKHLHCNNPNPHAEWEKYPVRVTTEATDWPLAPQRPPRAGVSAFAISGTIAHVVVEGNRASQDDDTTDFELSCPAGPPQNVAAPQVKSVPELSETENLVSRQHRLLPLSGKTPSALRELAGRYLSWLDNYAQEIALGNSAEESFLSNMAWTASVGRSHFSVRAGIIFEDANSLRDKLTTLAESDTNSFSRAVRKVAFVYPAEEGFCAGMAEELYQCEPVVRAVFDYCDKTIRTEHNTSLLEIMFDQTEGLGTSEWSCAVLYAFQCALSALWSSIGIQPDVVVSSRSGVMAAANSAGVLPLEDGLRFAVNRGRLAKSTSETDGIKVVQDSFEYPTPSIAMVNQVTGRLVDSGNQLDEAYWYGQVCEPAAFANSINTLVELGVDAVVEIGANETLSPEIVSAWSASGLDSNSNENSAKTPTVISSQLRPSDIGEELKARFVNAVAEMYEAGLTPEFTGLFAGEDRCRISLPNYPFQRRRFWFNDYIENSSQSI